jgi:hypothetical protein
VKFPVTFLATDRKEDEAQYFRSIAYPSKRKERKKCADTCNRVLCILPDHCDGGSLLTPVGSRPIFDELPFVANVFRVS